MYSSSSGGNIDNGPSLNDLFSINAQGNIVLSSELIAPTVTVVTINAQQENIINVDDLQVTGPVTATGDVIANSGLPNEVSLTALSEAVSLIDPSKVQNIISANAGQTIWKNQINMRDTLGNIKITLDPDGMSNSGFAAASIGVGSGGTLFTDFVAASTSNATTSNIGTLNITNQINMQQHHIRGLPFSVYPDDPVRYDTFQSFTESTDDQILAINDALEDVVPYNPTTGQINANSIVFPGDFQINGTNAALPHTSAQSLNVGVDQHILYQNGNATLGNGSIDIFAATNIDINVPTLVQSTLQVNSNLTVGPNAEFFVDASTGDVTALGNISAASFTGIQASDLPDGINALKIADGSVTNTEFQYLGGVTSDIQTQINGANTNITTLQGKTQNLSANLISSTFANDLIVQGNLQVQGTNTTNNSVVNVYDGYVSIVQNPADGTTPALNISQTGTASGSIMRVTDGDSNIKLEINQDCDVNINNGAFTVDSATGDIGTLGGLTAGGNITVGAGATQIQLKHNTGVIDCVDVHTTSYPTGVNSAITSLQSQVNARIPITNNKTYYVSLSGSDSNDGLSVGSAVLTLSRACTLAGGSGNAIVVFPGTYTETTSFTNQNLTIAAANFESGGIVNFTGVITVNNPASSVRILGLTFATLIHSGAGSLYLQNCAVNTTLSSSGTGYLSMTGCNTQGSGFSGTVSITGAGAKTVNINSGNLVGFLTVNNAVASVVVNNALSMAPITLTNGTLSILGNVSVYSAGPTLYAISSNAGTTLALDDVTILTPSNTPARISIGGFLSMRKVFFDKANSTLGTRLAQALVTDTIDVNSLTSATSSIGNTTTTQITNSNNINTASLAINAVAPTSGSVVDLGNSNSSLIVPKGTTGEQPSGVAGMIRYNTTNNQFEGYTTSWGQIGGSSFNPTITSVALGDNLYYDGSSWVNGYYIVAPTCQFSGLGRTISFTGSLTSPFNITESGRQYQAFNDSGLTSLANDSGLLASGATRNYTGILTPGNTYYFRGRFKGNYGSNYSPWSSVLPYTIPTVITPVAIWANYQNNAPTTSDQFGGGFYSQPNPATQSALLNLINGNGTTSEFIYLYNSSGSQPARLVLDYGTSLTFSSSTVQGQFRTVDSASAGGYTPNYCNGQVIAYWNGSNWITIYTLPTYPSSGSWVTTNFTFTTFTARYVSIQAISSGAMTTMLKLYNG